MKLCNDRHSEYIIESQHQGIAAKLNWPTICFILR